MATGDPIETVKRALAARDAGQHAEAARMLAELLEEAPELEAAHYELAFVRRLQGQHREAVRVLEDAFARDVASPRLLLLCGHMLHAAGGHAEGDECLDRVRPGTEAERDGLRALFDFGDYLRRFPAGRSMVLLDRLRRRHRWLEAPEVADRVRAALGEERPFALVRLGDGEGGMLTLSERDEARHRSLYRRNRDELIGMWFGPDFRWREGPFWAQAQRLAEAIAAADVVGIPYESWLAHEYRISSVRGVPSLVNIYRHLEAHPIGGAMCSQHVHLDLFRGGHLVPIIRSARTVHVVTCLPEARTALMERLGLADVVLHLIPAEQGSRAALGADAGAGVHYPDTFDRLLLELSRPSNGQLFLVAAGLLGKFYCQAVKQGGGVALDIGSLVDAWLEKPTRPGYGAELRL